jgi:hypothetical protein
VQQAEEVPLLLDLVAARRVQAAVRRKRPSKPGVEAIAHFRTRITRRT